MALPDMESAEWVTNIDSKDECWCLQVFMQCRSLQFPAEIVEASNKPIDWNWGNTHTGPDVKPHQDRIDNPRRPSLKDGEKDLYKKFKTWFENVRYSEERWVARCC